MATIEEIRAYAARIKVASDTIKDSCTAVARHMATVLEAALQFPKGDLSVEVYAKEDHAFMAQFSTKVEHVLYNVNGTFALVGDPASPVIETMTIGGHEPFAVNDDARLVQAFTDNLVRQVRETAKFKIEPAGTAPSR
jgi:enamine deaminase RidA (YjgF/YER057c/UK114 family)